MWLDIGIVALMLFGIYAFVALTGWQTRWLSRRTGRTAENMYDQFSDSPRKQRRYASEHGGESRNDSGMSANPRG